MEQIKDNRGQILTTPSEATCKNTIDLGKPPNQIKTAATVVVNPPLIQRHAEGSVLFCGVLVILR